MCTYCSAVKSETSARPFLSLLVFIFFTFVHPLPHFQEHTVATSFPRWWSVPETQFLSPSSPTVASQTTDSPPSGRLCILKILQVRCTQHTQTRTHSHLRHMLLKQLSSSLQDQPQKNYFYPKTCNWDTNWGSASGPRMFQHMDQWLDADPAISGWPPNLLSHRCPLISYSVTLYHIFIKAAKSSHVNSVKAQGRVQCEAYKAR